MLTLVVGAAASGKSEYAESLVLSAGPARRLYIATMEPLDSESHLRVERHRRLRAGKGFETLECYTNLPSADVPAGSVVLLECLGNLCANELYSPAGSGDRAMESILAGLEHLRRQCREVVVVSNEVFSGGNRYQGDTLTYLRVLAEVNRRAAASAERVYEVVCGIPVCHKGGQMAYAGV